MRSDGWPWWMPRSGLRSPRRGDPKRRKAVSAASAGLRRVGRRADGGVARRARQALGRNGAGECGRRRAAAGEERPFHLRPRLCSRSPGWPTAISTMVGAAVREAIDWGAGTTSAGPSPSCGGSRPSCSPLRDAAGLGGSIHAGRSTSPGSSVPACWSNGSRRRRGPASSSNLRRQRPRNACWNGPSGMVPE